LQLIQLYSHWKGGYNRVKFEGSQVIFAELAKHDNKGVVYTPAESTLTGNVRKNRLVGAGVKQTLRFF